MDAINPPYPPYQGGKREYWLRQLPPYEGGQEGDILTTSAPPLRSGARERILTILVFSQRGIETKMETEIDQLFPYKGWEESIIN